MAYLPNMRPSGFWSMATASAVARCSSPTRPAVPPRPTTNPGHQQQLALVRRVHHLLAAPLPAAATHLTGSHRPPPAQKEAAQHHPEQGNPAPPQRHAATPRHTTRDNPGTPNHPVGSS